MLQGELKQVATKSQEHLHQLHGEVRSLSTGSLHISAMGALWLFIGSVFGTASQELLKWVQ